MAECDHLWRDFLTKLRAWNADRSHQNNKQDARSAYVAYNNCIDAGRIGQQGPDGLPLPPRLRRTINAEMEDALMRNNMGGGKRRAYTRKQRKASRKSRKNMRRK